MGSHAMVESINEVLREAGLTHFRLGGNSVVIYAVMFDCVCAVVENGVARANVAVSRLSNTTRVDDAAFAAEGHGLRLRKGSPERVERVVYLRSRGR